MAQCRQLGVQFALDDFGTGYSSLTYLRRLPARLLKIDRSLVRDMLSDQEDRSIVEGIVGLARAFDRHLIAEGVTTIAHGTALLRLGCQYAQGYGIAKPMMGTEDRADRHLTASRASRRTAGARAAPATPADSPH
jgi:EAL domain-containing protein (putative c-di-GMP-specific phosphodiesterase class I)